MSTKSLFEKFDTLCSSITKLKIYKESDKECFNNSYNQMLLSELNEKLASIHNEFIAYDVLEFRIKQSKTKTEVTTNVSLDSYGSYMDSLYELFNEEYFAEYIPNQNLIILSKVDSEKIIRDIEEVLSDTAPSLRVSVQIDESGSED